MGKVDLRYFQQSDTLFLAKDLLGKLLVTKIDGVKTAGIITETEAYLAPEDKASHAYNFRKTKRNEVMYRQGGISYVYLCYGMHALFNIVTNKRGVPHAILIRAIHPILGIEMIKKRRGGKLDVKGPGKVTKALGIVLGHNGILLDGSTIWLEDREIDLKKNNIVTAPRVGIDYAEEYVQKPWRFILEGTDYSC